MARAARSRPPIAEVAPPSAWRRANAPSRRPPQVRGARTDADLIPTPYSRIETA